MERIFTQDGPIGSCIIYFFNNFGTFLSHFLSVRICRVWILAILWETTHLVIYICLQLLYLQNNFHTLHLITRYSNFYSFCHYNIETSAQIHTIDI